MTIYTAKQLSQATGIDPRHIWNDVRSRGIQPEKAHGIYVLTQAQYEKWTQLRADGYRAERPAAWKSPKSARSEPKRQQGQSNASPALESRQAANGRHYLVAPVTHETPAPWDWSASL